GDLRGGLGRTLHRLPAEILGVGVAGRVTTLHPDAQADGDAPRGALEDALVEDQTARGSVLEGKVGVVAPFGERDGEEPRTDGGVDARRPRWRERGAVARAPLRRGGRHAAVTVTRKQASVKKAPEAPHPAYGVPQKTGDAGRPVTPLSNDAQRIAF